MATDYDDVKLAIGEILGSSKQMVKSIDEVKGNFKELRHELRADQAKLDARLVVVEKFMWKAMGISLATSTALPIIITIIGWYLQR